jgi:ABC-2 type transport system ATP-binding protein
MTDMLEVLDVGQSFRSGFWLKSIPILHAVSFRVPERSVFGFLGENGAGKTTLIQLLVGLRTPTSGSVRVGGYFAHSKKARALIGYLPERPYFYEHLSGEGLLSYLGALSGMSRSQVVSRIPKVLSLVGLSAARKVILRHYSKGMLQRIGMAQALLHDPQVLVLDEPMSGLDPLGRKEMRELLVELATEGRTIFFSSHVLPDVEAICDQIALIRKGRLIGYGAIKMFLAKGPLHTEIAFSGIGIEEASGLAKFESIRILPHKGILAVLSNSDKINSLLKKLVEKEARVLWVNPIQPSLEDLFSKNNSLESQKEL